MRRSPNLYVRFPCIAYCKGEAYKINFQVLHMKRLEIKETMFYICSMKFTFDHYTLSRDMVLKRGVENRLTTRQAAAQIGISAATLSRAERRIAPPDMKSLLLICSWLGTAPGNYFLEIAQR